MPQSPQTRWTAPPPDVPFAALLRILRNRAFWNRLLLCSLAGLSLWLLTAGWSPAFPYRERLAPRHDAYARVEFPYDDHEATIRARQRARRNVQCFYQNDQRSIEETREALIDRLVHVLTLPLEEVDRSIWREFGPVPSAETDAGNAAGRESGDEQLLQFRAAVEGLEAVNSLKAALSSALRELEMHGLLDKIEHEIGEGSHMAIMVYPLNNREDARAVEISTVRLGEAKERLKQRLLREIKKAEGVIDAEFVASHVFNWLDPRLGTTLKLDKEATDRAIMQAEAAVDTVQRTFLVGDVLERPNLLATKVTRIQARVPLVQEDILLLRAEHNAYVASMKLSERIYYSLAHLGLYAAAFVLLTSYLYHREPDRVRDHRQFAVIVGLVWITIVLCWLLAWDVSWRGEVIPVTIFSMILALALSRELAVVLGGIVALVFSVGHGYGIPEFVILAGTSASAGLLCSKIRSRTKLVNIGVAAATVAFPTTLGINLMTGQPFSHALIMEAVWFSVGALFAGLLMTGLLPLLERWVGIVTDISLLELSDPNQTLLKQLVQRAPGTYNHSINVASIAESAAEAIGANGLLCRVGAYYHDIGKMRKPEYFIENQTGSNKHDFLVPSMSTLVIIAHVKEGAEMARKHHLPQRIIDLIEQHHGTTLIEYFYRQASEHNELVDPNNELEEANFRYPGPKPRTPEAVVLMLADAVESASRTLREPTPARIENLVTAIMKKKLEDGQFDECSITIQQLHTIVEQLVKSLNAMYHARVKYPGQQLA
ncbi:MAG TPA: HDIG domain-containing protein [Pirellulaceae bacterium]|nr:HDIG domain-containing protein [Pirellulaceae bacterium]